MEINQLKKARKYSNTSDTGLTSPLGGGAFHHEKHRETHHSDSTTHKWREKCGWRAKSEAGGLTSANSEPRQRVNK